MFHMKHIEISRKIHLLKCFLQVIPPVAVLGQQNGPGWTTAWTAAAYLPLQKANIQGILKNPNSTITYHALFSSTVLSALSLSTMDVNYRIRIYMFSLRPDAFNLAGQKIKINSRASPLPPTATHRQNEQNNKNRRQRRNRSYWTRGKPLVTGWFSISWNCLCL